MALYTCNAPTREKKAGKSGVQGQIQLYNEFKASLVFRIISKSKQTNKRLEQSRQSLQV